MTKADNEYISAIVRDACGNVTHYGRLARAGAGGSVEVRLTTEAKTVLDAGGKLYLYSERYNGDRKTDYASTLQEVGVPSAAPGHGQTAKT